MLEIGKANEVKFKVSVNGTAANPSVRLIIVTPQGDLGFPAKKLLGGGADDWFSEVKIPPETKAGEYDMRVEVIINNRLFTPLKRKVEVGDQDVVAAAPIEMQAEADATPAYPTQKPHQTDTWEGEGGALPEVPEIPQPLPSKPTEQKPKSLMQQFAGESKTVKTAPVRKAVKEHKKIVTPLPKPLMNKPTPTRITISEIAAESDKRFEAVLKEPKSYRKPGVFVAPININQQTPVTLKKGEVVYE